MTSTLRYCAGALLLSAVLSSACKKKEEPPPPSTVTAAPLPKLELPKPGADVQLVSMPTPARAIVSFRAQFKTGSIDDPKGREGLTALAARLLAEGGTQALSSSELASALFPMAAELAVDVSKETTTFTGRVHKDHLGKFLPLFLDVLSKPRYAPTELERLRADAIADIEKRLRTSDDESLGKEALDWLLYEGHPYQHFVGGTVAGLRAITLADVRAHVAKHFTRARLVFGLAGGFDAALEDRVRQGLAALPAGQGGRVALPPPPAQKTRVLIVDRPDASATALSLGHPVTLSRRDADYPAAFVARSIFGEHRQIFGRLFQTLREKRGLNYGDYAYIEHFEQQGWSTMPKPNVARRQQTFSIWIRPVEHAHALFALRGALYEAERLVKDGVTAQELDRARGFLAGYTLMWEQTDTRRLGFALDDQFYGSPPWLDNIRRALPALTVDALNAAVRKHIAPGKLKVVIVTRDGAKLAAALTEGKPSPITYASPKGPAILEEDKKLAAHPLRFSKDEVRVVPVGQLFER